MANDTINIQQSVPEINNPVVDIDIVQPTEVTISVDTDSEVDISVVPTSKLINDYNDLNNKPKINNVTLQGNKTSDNLGLQDKLVSGTNIKTINNQSILGSGDLEIKGGVTSVNGKTGDVVLDYSDVRADPQGAAAAVQGNLDTHRLAVNPHNITKSTVGLGNVANERQYSEQNPPPYPVTSVNSQTGNVVLDYEDVGADPSGAAQAVQVNLTAHTNDKTNPHAVTKSQVGLGNVANERQYSEENPPPYPVTSVAGKQGDVELEPSDVGADPEGSAQLVQTNLDTHTNATNPHNITKGTIGLGNVDNTSDALKPISNATQTALNAKQATLVSGQNIKTVGGQSILGSGDIQITTEPLDTQVKLSADLKTYYNIGKIQTASGTNPVLVGHAGDTLRQVFNNLMSMDEIQPQITAQPSISAFSLSSSASDEYGTQINTVNYSISTNQGSYTYQPSPTGVSWSKYTLSGGCAEIEKTSTSGSVTLSSTYTVGSSSAVSFTCVGTHTAGGIAKTNLGNNSDPIVQIQAGMKSRTANFSKTSVLYPYYMLSNSETITEVGSTGRTKSTQSACTSSGVSLTATTNQYVYFLLPASYGQKKIQYEALGQWYDWSAGTAAAQTITITLDSGATKADYKAYRTNSKMAVGTTKFRIVS